jgi:hypothetical protein
MVGSGDVRVETAEAVRVRVRVLQQHLGQQPRDSLEQLFSWT